MPMLNRRHKTSFLGMTHRTKEVFLEWTILYATSSLLLSILAHSIAANAAPTPALKVRDLVANADVIAMGTIIAVSDLGSTSVDINTIVVPGRTKFALLAADQFLKGPANTGPITIRFAQADIFVGHLGATTGQYRIFFLTRRGDEYAFTSPYYPSVPAMPGSLVVAGTALGRILEAEAEVVRSGGAPPHLKREAMHYLQDIDGSSPVSIAACRSALDDTDQSVRLTATAALLMTDNIDVLPIAESALLNSSSGAFAELMNIRVAIRDGVRVDSSTLPVFARLLEGGDVETRRAIAGAIRRGRSPAGLSILRDALDDPDVQVRYDAVMAFAETTGQRERGTSTIEFRARPDKYTEYWKGWLKNR